MMVILITKGAVFLRSSFALILINEINTNDFSDTAVIKQTSRRGFGKYQIKKINATFKMCFLFVILICH